MVSGVRFSCASGAFGGQPNNITFPAAAEIFQMQPGDTTSPLRLGFFGPNGAPNGSVIINTFQDRTHRTNHVGADLGQFINLKFSSSSVAIVSGVTFPNMQDIPASSGTLLCRFTEPSNSQVSTQNATFRAVVLNSASGVPNIDAIPPNLSIKAFELKNTVGGAGNASWSDLTTSTNQLTLNNQNATAMVHDFIVGVSVSPTATGTNRDFGFAVRLEFF
jgi:hypothetical protein